MEIKTFEDLIDWARQLHHRLSQCLGECSELHQSERAQALLSYLSGHEAELERITEEFEIQADPKALKTRIYDYLSHKPIDTRRTCDNHYATMDYDGIVAEIFHFHDQVIELYDDLTNKADIPEARSLLESLRDMERHEAMRLARQIGRMEDI